MLKQGTRPFYAIYYGNQFDGLNTGLIYLTSNPKEAINRFKWLYEKAIIRDYTNEDGEEYFNGRDYYVNIDKNDPAQVSGNFWYDDDDGGYCTYTLATVYTNGFRRWDGKINEMWENEYNRWAGR